MPATAVSFRTQMQERLRTAILDAAWARLVEADWEHVRMSDIAKDVGVSRQTVHNEFGTKDQLAAAMFRRELQLFLGGIVQHTRDAKTLEEALRASFSWTLGTAREHQLVRRIRDDAGAGRPTVLLALLTTEANAVVRPVRRALTRLYGERWAGEPQDVERIVDLAVRMGVSAILLPSDFLDDETMVDDMVTMVNARIRAITRS